MKTEKSHYFENVEWICHFRFNEIVEILKIQLTCSVLATNHAIFDDQLTSCVELSSRYSYSYIYILI